MVVAHGHFPTLAPLLGGPLCLVEEEVGTFSHGLGLHGGESPWLVMSKSGAPHSLAARCLLMDDVQVSSQDDWDLSESDRYKFWTDGKNG